MAAPGSLLHKLRSAPLMVRDASHLLFSKYLLVTNTTVACGLAGTADVIAQNYEMLRRVSNNWSTVRTRNLCIQGLLYGPAYHYWYIFLDRALPGRSVRVVLKKLAADQLLMTPLSVGCFFITLGLLEGDKFQQIQSDIRVKAPLLLTAEWAFGPATQLFNFFVLPTRFRVLYDSVVCLCFDVYYSNVKYRNEVRNSEMNSDSAACKQSDGI